MASDLRVRAGRECRVCGESRRSEMKNRAASVDGHEALCRPCAREEAAAYRAANIDRVRESRRRARARNPERHRAEVADWQRRNPDKVKAQGRRYRERNAELLRERAAVYREAKREACRERTRAWKKEHPVEVATYSRAYKLRASRTERASTAELAERVESDGVYGCAVCYGPAEHLDHIVPVSRGGCNCLSNLQWLCADCNLSKGARVFEDWLPVRLSAVRFAP